MSSDERSNEGLDKKEITRRDFLKVAGVGGAALGLAGGLSGALAACGTTSSSGGSSSGSSSGAEGRTIKVGFVSPLTGNLAAFGETDQWLVEQWKAAVKDGVQCGDGQVHPIDIIIKDSQSDSNRAATVAGDLVTNDGVDVMMVASTPDTVNPVADQAEALQVPCVSNDCPWQPYYFGRGATPDKPFTWTYHIFWGLEDVTAVFTGMWDQLKTNKKVGAMWPNDADGLGWADPKTGQPPMLKAAGYTVVDGGRFQDGTEDYTPQISKFKAANCEILSGVFIPPDFVNFWKQSYQQGFQPVAATVGKALLFPAELEAIGEIGYGLTTECWWSPWHPFKSSLTGQTCQQLADAWTSGNDGKEWNQTLLHYAVFEVVVDALKRATSVDDKQVVLDAIKATEMDTIQGHVTWSAGAPLNPVPNVCRSVLVGGMWTKGTDYPFELLLVDTQHAAEAPFDVTIPTNGKLEPISY
jgi:branched-chain amino acid transport system substrate-binding protein